MYDPLIAILGVVAVGAFATALKTWRDVALLKQDRVSLLEHMKAIAEIREKIIHIEDSVCYIQKHIEKNNRKETT